MNIEERDDLLIRLDERSRNTWRVLTELEQHNREQNGYIKDTIEQLNRNTLWRKMLVGVGGTLITLMAGWLFYLTMLV